MRWFLLPLALVACSSMSVRSQDTEGAIDARLLRQPDVSRTQIAFVYAGDVWIVPRAGGTAHRLTSAKGEESFPRFSPDGSKVAFSGNYDGNTDIYVIPAAGGIPERITHHPGSDRLIDWTPDGRSLSFATRMTGSGRFSRLYTVPATGGLPQPLPVPHGDTGAISEDGGMLALVQNWRDFRTWKRYRGGRAPDIWLFNLKTRTSQKVAGSDANDTTPMWNGSILYFLSDRDEHKRANLWALDTNSGKLSQITSFSKFDVRFPAIGPSDIVFECGGRLHLLDLAAPDRARPVQIRVVTDRSALKPRREKVGGDVASVSVSPSGQRAVVEARGEIFTVPAEHGAIRNLTHSSGVAERTPVWSPDGKQVVYTSDRSGEYELTLRNADGTGEETRLSSFGAGFRYRPVWSPDGTKLVFIDQAMKIHLFETESRTDTVIDSALWMYQGSLSRFRVSFSPDSRWIAWARGLENRHDSVFLYDTKEKKRHQVTSEFRDDFDPEFDPEGNYLYFLSRRTFTPSYGNLVRNWIYANTTNVLAVPLRDDVASPLKARNDEEITESPEGAEDTEETEKTEDKEEAEDTEKTIELERFERRAVQLPIDAGNYSNLRAVKGMLLYIRRTRTGAKDGDTPLVAYVLKDREEKTVLGDADGFEVSANGKKLLVRRDKSYAIIDAKPGQKFDKKLRLGDLEATVDPRAEWKQIFTDAWRIERDYFYDPGMHGVDWDGVRSRYGDLLDGAATRWDVNFLLGELIGELNASHTYRRGGDIERAPSKGVGLLGVDFALERGAYRIARIIESAAWDSSTRSPLHEAGVKEGEYLLAVNGVPIDTSKDPWAAFQGLSEKTVLLKVNGTPTLEGAREVAVKTLRSERSLRYRAWVEANRQRVEEASKGRVGYVYVPNTGRNGQTELVHQLRAQFHKEALIIDERWNGGGQIPDRFIELLNRPLLNYWGVRDGPDWQTPSLSHHGPKCMLINGTAGSGGDAFPHYFKTAGLGKLIGTRTWGGLIGMTGAPRFVDGGSVTVPTFGIYSPEGEWIIEGYGVDPDIEVSDDPAQNDPQLQAAIDEMLKALEAAPPRRPAKPKYPDRSR